MYRKRDDRGADCVVAPDESAGAAGSGCTSAGF